MINKISIREELEKSGSQKAKFIHLPFYYESKALESPHSAYWGMTLLTASSMRFRWAEKNENRRQVFKEILPQLKESVCSGNCSSDQGKCDCKLTPLSVELIHSKDVITVKSPEDIFEKKCDGIITRNSNFLPTVTVADCVPIFLYDRENQVIGVFHSGWKGTGIAGQGVRQMEKDFGSKAENICAAIGAHIDSCCYNVDKERADYFIENFGEGCISKPEDSKVKNPVFPYSLSLTQANLAVLKNAGIREENILVASDCTCCTKFSSGQNVFGSFRRQAAFLPPEVDADTRSRSMTVQAAFVYLS